MVFVKPKTTSTVKEAKLIGRGGVPGHFKRIIASTLYTFIRD